MFDFSLFAAAICTYTLWVVIRVAKKLDALGQFTALILPHLS